MNSQLATTSPAAAATGYNLSFHLTTKLINLIHSLQPSGDYGLHFRLESGGNDW